MGNCLNNSSKEGTASPRSAPYQQKEPSQPGHDDKSVNKTELRKRLQDARIEIQKAYIEIERLRTAFTAKRNEYNKWANDTINRHEQELGVTKQKIKQAAEQKLVSERNRHKQQEQQDKAKYFDEQRRLQRKNQELKDEKNNLLSRYLDEKSRFQRRNQEFEDEKNNLLTRLSAIAGAKLTDGNANIADLSDVNRPTKISERYSEIYDNEWTDAFDVLTKGSKLSEMEACKILARAFCRAYELCKGKAEDDLKNAMKAIKDLYGYDKIPTETAKEMKDKRKKLPERHTQALIKKYKEGIQALFPNEEEIQTAAVDTFLQECVKICWLMAIQDPQVFVDTNLQHIGEKLKTELYKPYTKSGPYIDFIVWPTLYLNKDGSILTKGVAQGAMEKRSSDNEKVAETVLPKEDEHTTPKTDSTESPIAGGQIRQTGIDSSLLENGEMPSVGTTQKEKRSSDVAASKYVAAHNERKGQNTADENITPTEKEDHTPKTDNTGSPDSPKADVNSRQMGVDGSVRKNEAFTATGTTQKNTGESDESSSMNTSSNFKTNLSEWKKKSQTNVTVLSVKI